MGLPTDTESPKPSVLGRGLGSLMTGRAVPGQGAASLLALSTIQRGPSQPREDFGAEALQELTASIREVGVLQPILVRPLPGMPPRYELVAGERRWRAAQLAGLVQIPAVIREVSDKEGVALALIENIQRQELTAVEEAKALKRLLFEFKLTHDQIAQNIGRSRASVSNLLRLLELPEPVLILLHTHKLGMGHARALLGLPFDEDRERVALNVVANDLSVRQTEALVRHAKTGKPGAPPKANAAPFRDVFRNETVHVQLQQKAPGRVRVVVDISDVHLQDSILEAIRLAATE